VAASSRHNRALRNLARIIERAAAQAGSQAVVCDGGEWEISTPVGVRKPDVFIVPREVARAAIIDESPRLIPGTELNLVVEVISPGNSERADWLREVSEYARLGVPQYWVVEHIPRLTIQVLALADGTYLAAPTVAEGARFEAVIDADKPITVAIDPAELDRGWRRPVGGAFRALRAADGWLGLSLAARPTTSARSCSTVPDQQSLGPPLTPYSVCAEVAPIGTTDIISTPPAATTSY
jgi:Putative restriction endonuclease